MNVYIFFTLTKSSDNGSSFIHLNSTVTLLTPRSKRLSSNLKQRFLMFIDSLSVHCPHLLELTINRVLDIKSSSTTSFLSNWSMVIFKSWNFRKDSTMFEVYLMSEVFTLSFVTCLRRITEKFSANSKVIQITWLRDKMQMREYK